MNSTVKDVMTRSVVAVHETADYKDIVTVMRRRRVSAFPVVDSAGHVLGVVSEADLLLKEAAPVGSSAASVRPWAGRRRREQVKAAGVTAGELMSKPAVTITGQVERDAVASHLIEAVRHVEGVVDVRDRVSYPPDGVPKIAGLL